MKHEHIHISESVFSLKIRLNAWEHSIKEDCYKENCSIKYEWEIYKRSHKIKL